MEAHGEGYGYQQHGRNDWRVVRMTGMGAHIVELRRCKSERAAQRVVAEKQDAKSAWDRESALFLAHTK